MAIETKELLKALNLPETLADAADVKEFVTKHNESFVPLSEAHTDERVVEKVTGKFYGSLGTEAKRLFDLKNEDIKDKKFEEVLKLGVEKLNGKIKELSLNTGDEKVAAITKERDTLKAQADQYKSEMEKVLGEKTALETDFNGKIKGFKVASIYKEAKAKLAFSDGIPEVAKLGFDSLISSKYEVSLDDKDNVQILTKEGKKVSNPTKSGTFLSLDEVLDKELDEAGLKKKNNLNGNQPFKFGQPANQNNNNNGGTEKVFTPNAKAVAHAERLAEAAKR